MRSGARPTHSGDELDLSKRPSLATRLQRYGLTEKQTSFRASDPSSRRAVGSLNRSCTTSAASALRRKTETMALAIALADRPQNRSKASIPPRRRVRWTNHRRRYGAALKAKRGRPDRAETGARETAAHASSQTVSTLLALPAVPPS